MTLYLTDDTKAAEIEKAKVVRIREGGEVLPRGRHHQFRFRA
jgi:hypothetical protein